ncbi:MAG: helix-turn-helix domain-containing protein [Dehalococcoidia bacterium]
MGRSYDQNCPIALTLDVVGDRWTMLIVRELLNHGERRFADLEQALAGIAPNVLSERLRHLEDSGMVERAIYSERPLRAWYQLTEQGRDLGFVAGALSYFGTRHMMKGAKVTHGDGDHAITIRYYCPDCGERVPAGEVWPQFAGGPAGPFPGAKARLP